jgi:hypothetical protein
MKLKIPVFAAVLGVVFLVAAIGFRVSGHGDAMASALAAAVVSTTLLPAFMSSRRERSTDDAARRDE